MKPASRTGSAKLMAVRPRIRLRTAARAGAPARSAASPRRRWPAKTRSQSPAVESSTWSAPARRSAWRTSSRSAAAAAAKRSRTRRLRVSTCTWRPVSGSTSHRSPAETSSCSRGSTISTAITPWRARSACSGPSQSRSPRKSETITTSPRWRPSAAVAGQRGAQRGRAHAVALAFAAQLGEQPEQAQAALARAQDARLAAAEREHAEPVAAPRRDVADGERDALGDVDLAPVGGAEGHRGRDVEHQPRRQRALADVHAHVRLLQPRGRVPVDVAHVVAGVVRPDHRQLGAGADLRRQVLAGDEALDPLHHRQVERAQDLRAGRARARACPASARARRDEPGATHGSLPTAREPEARAGQQQHQRAAGERRRHLPLLLDLGQPRAEVAIDGGELVARRRWRRTGRRCRARCPAASAGRAGPARCWSRRCSGRCA